MTTHITGTRKSGLAARRKLLERRRTSRAAATGYFDQSHFIHDFRRATGTTPHAFFRHAAAK